MRGFLLSLVALSACSPVVAPVPYEQWPMEPVQSVIRPSTLPNVATIDNSGLPAGYDYWEEPEVTKAGDCWVYPIRTCDITIRDEQGNPVW